MPTYIVLVNLTQKGAENIDQSPDRLEKVIELTESLGGEYKDFYMTFGRYDFVYIADLPDDEAAAHLALTYGRGGAGETETLKAFTEDEYREIITDLSD
jgi:uncharacterized protein with GYD domain